MCRFPAPFYRFSRAEVWLRNFHVLSALILKVLLGSLRNIVILLSKSSVSPPRNWVFYFRLAKGQTFKIDIFKI